MKTIDYNNFIIFTTKFTFLLSSSTTAEKALELSITSHEYSPTSNPNQLSPRDLRNLQASHDLG